MRDRALRAKVQQLKTQADELFEQAQDDNDAQIWCRKTAAEARAEGRAEALGEVLALLTTEDK